MCKYCLGKGLGLLKRGPYDVKMPWYPYYDDAGYFYRI